MVREPNTGERPSRRPARVVLVGGFLGAGKTTLLLAAARHLTAAGQRVGLVTNDQGADLVDTSLAVQRRVPVEEVAGGCFCCRFPDLLVAFEQLQAQVQPDVILAEPVGSCTDLMATVLLPLARYYADRFDLAPLTVLMDATRPPASPSSAVGYLQRKQLAEAEILALNKVDLLAPAQSEQIAAELRRDHPEAHVVDLAAATGAGLEAWLAQVMAQQSRLTRVLDLDYARYAEAEAALAWANVKAVVRAAQPFAADQLIARILQDLAHFFTVQQLPIAHLKAQLLSPTVHLKGSVTAAGKPVYWDMWEPGATADRAQLLINVRVEGEPGVVERAIRQVLAQAWADAQAYGDIVHFECFRPKAPEPTHRLG